jgi:hypothetical protein
LKSNDIMIKIMIVSTFFEFQNNFCLKLCTRAFGA